MATPPQTLGQMVDPGMGEVSLTTLAAAFLLVGGLLTLAKRDGLSSQSYRGRISTRSNPSSPPLAADGHGTD